MVLKEKQDVETATVEVEDPLTSKVSENMENVKALENMNTSIVQGLMRNPEKRSWTKSFYCTNCFEKDNNLSLDVSSNEILLSEPTEVRAIVHEVSEINDIDISEEIINTEVTCQECHYVAINEGDLKVHRRNVHTYKCDKCPEKVENKESLDRHISQEHENVCPQSDPS